MNEKEFLESIVKNIVSTPDDVEVTKEIDEIGIKLSLKVHPSDMGKIIGSQGRMANSIRTIMHAFGGNMDKKVSVLIIDSQK